MWAPDYPAIITQRINRIVRIRTQLAKDIEDKAPVTIIQRMYAYYRDNPVAFIQDWGCTYDPRNSGTGRSTVMPFVLFPKQVEWLQFAIEHWQNGEPANTAKSRELGVSWLAVALADTLAIFHRGFSAGFGSRVEDLVDMKGNPDSLFWKARFFLENVPVEFRSGWARAGDAHMRLDFPQSGSSIIGEGGLQIGRGGRQSIYFVDESAFLPNPENIEASLSFTTNARHDISSYNGTNNPFYRRTTEGKIPTFIFPWTDDPRKDDAWYALQCERLPAYVVASEIDMNPSASVDRIVIQPEWVKAAINAHIKLGINVRGIKRGALDVADEGKDANAFITGYGILISRCDVWSGKGINLQLTTERAFALADENEVSEWRYDADGMGAAVRGDAIVINERRAGLGQPTLKIEPYRGSGEVLEPNKPIEQTMPAKHDPSDKTKPRLNGDFFANAKAQSWWSLARRFERTYRAVQAGNIGDFNPDDLISIDGAMPNLSMVVIEMSQPQFADPNKNRTGKMVIDKQPNGAKSPNTADGVMMYFSGLKRAAPGFWDLKPAVQATQGEQTVLPPVTAIPAPRQMRPPAPRGRMFR